MQMEPQVTFDCEARLHAGNIFIGDGDGDDGETSSSQDHAAILQPVKKQTRKWAAWTRQEQERFFTALRQVGKNFEKITSRVQSKNKDQVRHYYYRLVRRMNKLLGPELCLDAKNSKDTNAAMLRWWSLLEKYSCKASKLHLKPRRFKIFIETLEHQLLKDRKKNSRKRSSHGENCPPAAPTTVSNHGKTPGHDAHAMKVVLVDSQNIQKSGPGKGSSLKRNVNLNINHSNCKGDSSSVKTVRQRRKAATVSTAAYKRWEKAAIAGVSLVADAAEQLERTATDREFDEHVQNPEGENVLEPVGKDFPSMPSSKNLFMESNTQTSIKLKLQLFPIDDGTRRALELDNHNPHLELTLSSRKKICSVLEHLNRKWGNSSIASGELMLFPYDTQRENLVGYHRWTLDSMLCAADVFSLIGSPPVFRLRYGWFSCTELGSSTLPAPSSSCSILGELHPSNAKEQIVDLLQVPAPGLHDHQPETCMDPYKDKHVSGIENTDVTSSTYLPNEMVESIDPDPNNKLLESSNCAPSISSHGRESDIGAVMRQQEIMDDMRLHNSTALSAVDWADSLTNISVGDLLSEVSHDMDSNCIDPPLPGIPQCLSQIPFSCDSFDAAIAAHIYRDQDKTGIQPALVSHMTSIWDADETCDAFSFQKITVSNDIQSAPQIVSSGDSKEINRISSERPGTAFEGLPDAARAMDYNSAHGDPVDDDYSHGHAVDDDPAHADQMECQPYSRTSENSSKDLNELTDIYWPDSLGPLDLDLSSSRYHSEDQILSDSLSGVNRLIASSLDAFQNCSFFGLDKKESASTVEARETVSFSDYKIGSQV